MRTIRIHTGQPYPVLIGRGLLATAGARVRRALRPSRIIVVTSSRVSRLHGRTLLKSLRAAAWIRVPEGETAKTPAVLTNLLEVMARTGVDRNACVMAFGGGSVGDVAGMAASLYMRGIAVVQVPTTLLAQVDSAVGGKTAVNLAGVKNLVGTFHQPRMVIADTDVLATLPEREYRAGIYEALKCGAIADKSLFAFCEKNAEKLLARDAAAVERVIAGALKVKANVVGKDERESGLRRILNFGHTVGHALEAIAGPRKLLHGEAVALGMMAAAEIGVNLGVTPVAVAERLIAGILSFGSLPLVRVNVAQAMSRIAMDKKSRDGRARFVLLEAVGSAVVREVPAKLVRDAVRSVIA